MWGGSALLVRERLACPPRADLERHFHAVVVPQRPETHPPHALHVFTHRSRCGACWRTSPRCWPPRT